MENEHEYYANNVLVANCHATVYYVIARNRKAKEFEFVSEQEQKKDIIERTATGFKMKSLKEVIELGQQNDEE